MPVHEELIAWTRNIKPDSKNEPRRLTIAFSPEAKKMKNIASLPRDFLRLFNPADWLRLWPLWRQKKGQQEEIISHIYLRLWMRKETWGIPVENRI